MTRRHKSSIRLEEFKAIAIIPVSEKNDNIFVILIRLEGFFQQVNLVPAASLLHVSAQPFLAQAQNL